MEVPEDGSITDMEEWLKRRRKKEREKLEKERLKLYIETQEARDKVKEQKRRENVQRSKGYASAASKRLRNA